MPSLTPEELLDAISDDVLAHGNLSRALQRLALKGFQSRTGERLRGIQEMLQQLRNKRQETLERYNLDSVMNDIKDKMRDVIKTERHGMDSRLDEARKRFKEMQSHGLEEEGSQFLKPLENVVSKNQAFLDNLPPDVGGQVKELSKYDFMDPEARKKFQDIMDTLKKNVMESYVKDLHEQLKGLTPEDMKRFGDMARSLNEMLRQKARGKDPDFKKFMEQFGQYFGQNPPSNMDELMEQLSERMAQARSLMESLSPEARQSLEDLMNSLLQDDGLKDALAELMAHLEESSRGSKAQYPFHGQEPVSLTEAMKLMEQLQELAEIEKQLMATQRGNSLDNIDPEKVRQLLGEDAYQNLEELKKMSDLLEENGYVSRQGDRLELTPKGMRTIGQKALREVFSYLKKDRFGKHQVENKGVGGESHEETKPYEFGDPFFIDMQQTLMNALEREGLGTPLKLDKDDFEVFRPQQVSQCATVLMLDLSWSMPMRGNFMAAKKVAVALEALIRTQFPRDSLYIVGFSDAARELTTEKLMNIEWNEFVYGTNMHHGFQLSRKLLSRHKTGNRQIIMITDGEPTAHQEGGHSYFEYPPSPRTLELTLLEAKRCAQSGIVINSFMLGQGHDIERFVDMLAKVTRGRVFFTTSERLGQYVLVDYVGNKRKVINP